MYFYSIYHLTLLKIVKTTDKRQLPLKWLHKSQNNYTHTKVKITNELQLPLKWLLLTYAQSSLSAQRAPDHQPTNLRWMWWLRVLGQRGGNAPSSSVSLSPCPSLPATRWAGLERLPFNSTTWTIGKAHSPYLPFLGKSSCKSHKEGEGEKENGAGLGRGKQVF